MCTNLSHPPANTAGGIGAWEQNSRIVRASSPTPGGEYTVEEQIKPPFAHEPVLQQLADGRWLLYSIGNSSSAKPPRTDCAGGYSPRTYACARVAALQASLHPYSPLLVCGVALAYNDCCHGWHVIVCFTHGHTMVERTGNAFVAAIPDEVYLTAGRALGPEANWTRVPVDINPQLGHAGQHGDGGDINPAPLVFANGSVVMMWRGGDHWYDVHLAHSSDWATGPYNSSLSGSVRHALYIRMQTYEYATFREQRDRETEIVCLLPGQACNRGSKSVGVGRNGMA